MPRTWRKRTAQPTKATPRATKSASKLIVENKCDSAPFLDLSNCHDLTTLPDEISNFLWLRNLDISRTPYSNLSPLASLFKLEQLEAWSTKISDLKPLKGLLYLKKLYMWRTLVDDISPLVNLLNLEELDISNTQVSDISPLVNLINLKKLNISNTSVSDLSPLVPLIKKGLSVRYDNLGNGDILVKDCPLTNPPVTIVLDGNAAILNYFNEAQIQGTDYLYEAKLLLVGEGDAGKTSLFRRLFQPEQPLPAPDETTKGIDIYCHEFKITDSRYPEGRTFRLNVWDFGGQEIYHAAHQFFLTQRSLYILLDDTRRNHMTIHDEGFKYWLEAVDLLSNHSPMLIFQNERGGSSKKID